MKLSILALLLLSPDVLAQMSPVSRTTCKEPNRGTIQCTTEQHPMSGSQQGLIMPDFARRFSEGQEAGQRYALMRLQMEQMRKQQENANQAAEQARQERLAARAQQRTEQARRGAYFWTKLAACQALANAQHETEEACVLRLVTNDEKFAIALNEQGIAFTDLVAYLQAQDAARAEASQ